MHSTRFLAVQVILLGALAAQGAFHSLRMGGRSELGTAQVALVEIQESVGATAFPKSSSPKPRSFKLVSEKDLRLYVARNVSNIKQVVKSPRYTVKEKLDFIRMTTKAVADYRAQSWTKSAYAEIEMDLSIKPFETFPDSARFKVQQCEQYENRLLLEWEPGAQDSRPAQRGVSEALAVLKQICRS